MFGHSWVQDYEVAHHVSFKVCIKFYTFSRLEFNGIYTSDINLYL